MRKESETIINFIIMRCAYINIIESTVSTLRCTQIKTKESYLVRTGYQDSVYMSLTAHVAGVSRKRPRCIKIISLQIDCNRDKWKTHRRLVSLRLTLMLQSTFTTSMRRKIKMIFFCLIPNTI
jgi:hypothetical protein